MRKKKGIIILLLLCSVQLLSFGQGIPPKHYADYKNGYSGYVGSIFIADNASLDGFREYAQQQLQASISKRGGSWMDKLSKNSVFLCYKALGEWDYKPGEIYRITIFLPNVDHCEDIFVRIEKDMSFRWIGAIEFL